MAALVTSVPTDDFWLPMGGFSVTGDSGSSEGGAITPTSTPEFEANLNASSAGAGTKSFLAQANSLPQNILQLIG